MISLDSLQTWMSWSVIWLNKPELWLPALLAVQNGTRTPNLFAMALALGHFGEQYRQHAVSSPLNFLCLRLTEFCAGDLTWQLFYDCISVTELSPVDLFTHCCKVIRYVCGELPVNQKKGFNELLKYLPLIPSVTNAANTANTAAPLAVPAANANVANASNTAALTAFPADKANAANTAALPAVPAANTNTAAPLAVTAANGNGTNATNTATPLASVAADGAMHSVVPVGLPFALLSARYLLELDSKEQTEVWYKPTKYLFYLEFTNLDAAKKHLQADEYHWNVKGLGSYAWKTKEVMIHILGCDDQAITISGLHRAEDKVGDLTSRCCWRAKVLVCQLTRRARLYLPEYNGDDGVNSSFEKASQMYGATRAHEKFVSVEPLNLWVTNHGHIIPKEVKLRGCHPAVKEKFHELLQTHSERDAKYMMLTNPVFSPFAQFFEGILLKERKAGNDERRQEPATNMRKQELIHAKLGGNVAFDAVPPAWNHGMIVSDLFCGEVVQLVGTAASFCCLAKSSFYYSDATFNVMQYNGTKLIGVMTHDAEGNSHTLALMQVRSESHEFYELFMKLCEKAKKLVADAGHVDGGISPVVRYAWDGFSGMKALVRRVLGNDVARVACLFHVLSNFRKVLDGMHASDGLKCAAKRFLFELGRAPSASAYVRLANDKKSILIEAVTVDGSIDPRYAEVWKLIERMIDRNCETFGCFQSFAPVRIFAMGPVANRTTNAAESGWGSLKRDLNRTPNPPACSTDLDVFLVKHIINHDLLTSFKSTWDLIFDSGSKAMKFKTAAMLAAEIVSCRHVEAGVAVPESIDITSRFFFLHRETGLLFALAEADMRSAIGELIEDRGAHLKLNDAQFKAQVDGLDGAALLHYHLCGYLIQFHRDHLPGCERSYDFADCDCQLFRKSALCSHVLMIHLRFFRRRHELNLPTMAGEENGWPSKDHYKNQVGVPLTWSYKDFTFEQEDLSESEAPVAEPALEIFEAVEYVPAPHLVVERSQHPLLNRVKKLPVEIKSINRYQLESHIKALISCPILKRLYQSAKKRRTPIDPNSSRGKKTRG